ncbi:hypothetical protein [Brucella pituitosa]|uniref:hypothetical protein n=1 Tax=Brucella pituitosa TaxID=571256 RepID=UPI003F4AF05E
MIAESQEYGINAGPLAALAPGYASIYFQLWYAGFAGNLIALWTIIEMGLVKGDHYANRFGPPAIEIGEGRF